MNRPISAAARRMLAGLALLAAAPLLAHGTQFPRLTVAGIDAHLELAKAADRRGQPLRFAVGRRTDITLASAGRWATTGAGQRLWRLELVMPGATDLNLGLTDVQLPPGAELEVDANHKGRALSLRYTAADATHGRLWTPIMPGPVVRLTLRVPARVEQEPELRISKVSGGFRDAWQLSGGPGLKAHGECNNDVACAKADPWRDQVSAVAVYSVEGEFMCSGTLIADVPGSRRPFFLSAHHCRVTPHNADSVVTYWNFEAPECGLQQGGSLKQSIAGATWLAARADVDMVLMELHGFPDQRYGAHHSGWDRRDVAPAGSVGIHHPSAQVKSISFNSEPLTSTASCILADGKGLTHWEVDDWEDGTTEPGSSGSGLWDADSKRLVGILSGGDAACNNPSGFDCYGKFAVAWDGPTDLSRLKDWLDPDDVSPLSVPGIRPDLMFGTGFEPLDPSQR